MQSDIDRRGFIYGAALTTASVAVATGASTLTMQVAPNRTAAFDNDPAGIDRGSRQALASRVVDRRSTGRFTPSR